MGIVARPYQSFVRGALTVVLAILLLQGCVTPEPTAESHLAVLTLNIWNDKGDWPARRSAILSEMRSLDPDVVFLQEVLENPELPNQAMELADSLGYNYYFSSVDSVDRPKRFGNAILTDRAIAAEGWHPLMPLNDYRNIGYVSIPWRDGRLDLYVVHLHHLPDSTGSSIRAMQITDALKFISSTSSSRDILLAGDFNAAPDESALRLLDSAFIDVADKTPIMKEVDTGVGRPTTLNPEMGHTPRWIDYVFVGTQSSFRPIRVERVMDKVAPGGVWPSDHFGVFVELEATEGVGNP